MKSLDVELLGRTRAAVLGALLLHPERAVHVRELARMTQASPGSLHRELRLLADLGLVLRHEQGRQVLYQANKVHPVFAELAAVLRKTGGVADVLRQAIAPLGDAVTLAFVYGSMAAGTAGPVSDVDVMLLGRVSFADAVRALAPTSQVLGREVNPTPMEVAGFARKWREGDGFVRGVAQGPRIWLKGGEHEFAELAEPASDRSAQGASADA